MGQRQPLCMSTHTVDWINSEEPRTLLVPPGLPVAFRPLAVPADPGDQLLPQRRAEMPGGEGGSPPVVDGRGSYGWLSVSLLMEAAPILFGAVTALRAGAGGAWWWSWHSIHTDQRR